MLAGVCMCLQVYVCAGMRLFVLSGVYILVCVCRCWYGCVIAGMCAYMLVGVYMCCQVSASAGRCVYVYAGRCVYILAGVCICRQVCV